MVWGAWVAQSVKHPTLAQIMVLWFTSSSPMLGSVLTAQSLELALDSVSPSLSAPPPLPPYLSFLSLPLSLSLKINIKKMFLKTLWFDFCTLSLMHLEERGTSL